ncbi:hypothetical protein SCLCIDRAFT_28780 [Scleroderma citrinum Foug A]|uniref:Uncharacterized protein n=1 Tax=Scleroderma citrinum Foug A TaxID=1036808 RepID=A0A0C3DA10_9AGAM|nr:hypothetical protein SCLCIDRAFT_28780 [Scleroderma citrinum Foug A]
MEPTGKTSEEGHIPKLAEDGRNWKIYCMKYLEVAATERLLSIVAGWESDNGSKDWVHRAGVARLLFLMTTPSSFRHHFNPIKDPRAKKLVTSANKTERVGAATEHAKNSWKSSQHGRNSRRWRSRKWDNEEDLSTTKDLSTRGMEDPCMSREASAEGNSAERTDGTSVLCAAMPHETPNQLQNSLQATRQRLPIEDEPCMCEQEAVESIVTARHTKGTAQSANPPEMDANADRTTLLGREPVERASGVDEGNRMECEPQPQLQYINCKANDQRDRNTRENVPGTHGSPLVGEWEVCASGEMKNSIEDGPSESKVAEDTAGVKLRGHREGTSESKSIDKADGNVGRRIEPADTPNKSEELVTVSIELENLESSGIPHVCLGGTWMQTGNANGPGSQADASSGQADGLTGQMDTSNASNRAETAGMSKGEGADMYLGARGMKCGVREMDGIGSQTDVSTWHRDVLSVETHMKTATDRTGNVRIRRKEPKMQNSPIGPKNGMPKHST